MIEMITLDKNGNVEDTESKTDLFGLGIFSKNDGSRVDLQSDSTYYANKNSKQAKQLTAAAMNIVSIPFVVVSNLMNSGLKDISKVFSSVAASATKPVGKTTGRAQTTPFQFSLPSPQSLFQLPIGKAEENEVEVFEEKDDEVEVF